MTDTIYTRIASTLTVSREQSPDNTLGAAYPDLALEPPFERCGIPATADSRIHYRQYVQYRQALCLVMSDENAGFLTRAAPVGTQNLMCRALGGGYNWREVLLGYCEFNRVFNPYKKKRAYYAAG